MGGHPLRRQMLLQGLALLLALTACAVRQQMAAPQACRAVQGGDGARLQDCLDSLPRGARLALPQGRLVLSRPLVLRRAVILTTAEVAADSPRCAENGAGCAVLALRLATPGGPTERAVTIAAEGSVLDHLVIEGPKADPARDDTGACRGLGRPSMGDLAITASNVAITNSVIRDAACYSAVVADEGVGGLRFVNNAVLSNGTHNQPSMWADGLTLIDGTNDVVRDNLFRDNTDVQLVLGGCLRCTVADNRFEASADPAAASFTALLVHGWPATSGDYEGTAVLGNSIDCGLGRGCGFGLAIGGRGWYSSPTSGGVIAGNSIRHAAIGINVDNATGPVTMRDNQVSDSGGVVISHCGLWFAGPVNIAEASRRFVDQTAGVAMASEAVTDHDFYGCLPGT